MKSRKILGLAVFILVLLTTLLSAGCGDKGMDMEYSVTDIARKELAMEASGGSAGYDGGYGPAANYWNSPDEKEAEKLALSATDSTMPAERKIIRDANMTLQVESVEKAYDNIAAVTASMGGYEANKNMYIEKQGIYDYNRGYIYISAPALNATLKIPSGRLDQFLAAIKGEGEVISQSTSSADITDQYFDAQIELTMLEMMLENYYRFLENAKDVDEQLKVTRSINDTKTSIEKLKGKLRQWDSFVEYSTVWIYLSQPFDLPEPEPEPRVITWDSLSLEDVGWLISSGFVKVVNAIYKIFLWIIIALAVASPILVPAALLIIFAVRSSRKKARIYMQTVQARKAAQTQANTNNNNPGDANNSDNTTNKTNTTEEK